MYPKLRSWLTLFAVIACVLSWNVNAFADVQKNTRSLEINERGTAAVKVKDFDLAEKLFREALALDPYNITAAYNLAGTYAVNKKEGAAIQLLEDYTERDPKDAGLFARLGDTYFGTKNLEKAELNYEKALQLDPTLAGVAAKLSTVYSLLNKLGKAEKMLAQAVKQNPNDSQLYANLSSVQLANGKIDGAITTAKRSLQIKATREVYVTLGTAYELSKNFKNALIAFQRAADLGDDRGELEKKIIDMKKASSVG